MISLTNSSGVRRLRSAWMHAVESIRSPRREAPRPPRQPGCLADRCQSHRRAQPGIDCGEWAMHSDARRGVTGGGAMTHTSLPRRWTRKRAPSDSIRSSSFENERLPSVAEIRCSRALSVRDLLSDLPDMDLILSRRQCACQFREVTGSPDESWSVALMAHQDPEPARAGRCRRRAHRRRTSLRHPRPLGGGVHNSVSQLS